MVSNGDMERGYQNNLDGGQGAHDAAYRRTLGRKYIDYGSSMVHWMRHRRPGPKPDIALETERPSGSYIVDMLPPVARLTRPADSIPAKHAHSSLNKVKHPINIVRWTPEGRRCLTGSTSGEFTLWNGMAFNFETIMQAHDAAIRAATYSHAEDWLVSADHEGLIKYWQPNFNNVQVIQAHHDAIRDLAFAPNDGKFVTACDDASLKIFDFAAGVEESTLTGHNWDAKSVDWHPTKGLLVSGSKDHQVKLWDPRTGRCLTTLHGHKNTVSKTTFDTHRGHMLATCGRDPIARIFDLRMMRDMVLLRGHEKDISTLTWHPVHPNMISTGGADGAIFHYLLDEPNTPVGTSGTISPYDTSDPSSASTQTIYPAHKIQYAHDFAVWALAWHPLGHILASGSNDRVTRFWVRPRPGETHFLNDRYHLGEAAAEAVGTWDRRGGRRAMREDEEQEMEDEADGLVDQTMPTKDSILPGLPGLPGLNQGPAPLDASTGIGNLSLPLHFPAQAPEGNGAMPPPPPGAFAGMKPEDFAHLMAEGKIVVPPPPPGSNGVFPPPLPPNFDLSKIPPDLLARMPGPFPNGIPPPPPGANGAPPAFLGAPTAAPMERNRSSEGRHDNDNGNENVRRRAPLPSQKESLRMEQRRGNYRHAR